MIHEEDLPARLRGPTPTPAEPGTSAGDAAGFTAALPGWRAALRAVSPRGFSGHFYAGTQDEPHSYQPGGLPWDGVPRLAGLVEAGPGQDLMLQVKNPLHPGDRLVLTKPIGSGVLTLCLKEGDLPAAVYERLVCTMERLNMYACRVTRGFDVRAMTDITGYVQDSGEGRWTVQQAVDTGVPAEVITLSLMRRFRSRQQDPFSERVLAALRREFGGHAVVSKEK